MLTPRPIPPQTRRKKQRESVVESTVCAYARAQGCKTLKIRMATGWPDRLITLPRGRCKWAFAPSLFVEFKAPGQKPRPEQVKCIHDLQATGYQVEVIDNIVDGRRLVDAFIQSHCLPA